jgi:hypothetical protein
MAECRGLYCEPVRVELPPAYQGQASEDWLRLAGALASVPAGWHYNGTTGRVLVFDCPDHGRTRPTLRPTLTLAEPARFTPTVPVWIAREPV